MTDVLDTIERELIFAVRRSNARRRRRRKLSLFTGVVVSVGAVAGGGIAAVTDTPIDRLFGGETKYAAPASAPRVDVRVTDPGGLGWTVTTYVPTTGGIATAIAADGLAANVAPVHGRSGYAIASNLLRGPLAGGELEVVRAGGSLHYLFGGTVGADATRVVVELGGTRETAQLSGTAVTVPVDKAERAGDRYTPQGAVEAALLPDEVSVLTYAITLPPDALAGSEIVRGTVETTLADGSKRRQATAPFCVSATCGLRVSKAAGPGRAG